MPAYERDFLLRRFAEEQGQQASEPEQDYSQPPEEVMRDAG